MNPLVIGFWVTVGAIRIVWRTLVLVGEAFWWMLWGIGKGRDHWRALRNGMAIGPDMVLRCPEGHAVETEGVRCQCENCKFVYVGSILLCPNCGATTPYTDCPTCGLSVDNPFIVE